MTSDEIIKLAREAGIEWDLIDEDEGQIWYITSEGLLRFAALVAAAEREACARVCEGRTGGAVQSTEWWSGFKSAMKQCAASIRARGDNNAK